MKTQKMIYCLTTLGENSGLTVDTHEKARAMLDEARNINPHIRPGSFGVAVYRYNKKSQDWEDAPAFSEGA